MNGQTNLEHLKEIKNYNLLMMIQLVEYMHVNCVLSSQVASDII